MNFKRIKRLVHRGVWMALTLIGAAALTGCQQVG